MPIRIRYPDDFRYPEKNIRQYPILTSSKTDNSREPLAAVTKD
jgi:hypothetical protein